MRKPGWSRRSAFLLGQPPPGVRRGPPGRGGGPRFRRDRRNRARPLESTPLERRRTARWPDKRTSKASTSGPDSSVAASPSGLSPARFIAATVVNRFLSRSRRRSATRSIGRLSARMVTILARDSSNLNVSTRFAPDLQLNTHLSSSMRRGWCEEQAEGDRLGTPWRSHGLRRAEGRRASKCHSSPVSGPSDATAPRRRQTGFRTFNGRHETCSTGGRPNTFKGNPNT